MGDSWAQIISTHWPWLVPIIILGAVAFYTLKGVPLIKAVFAPFARAIRRLPQKERARVDAELADLRRVVNYQGDQIAELRYRDEMNWSFVLTDQEWHRTFEFTATANGWAVPPHVSYMEHRAKWLSAHPIPDHYKDLP